MIYNEYDPLQEVIIGDVHGPGELDHLFDHNVDGFNSILEETKEDLDKLSSLLKEHNVIVHRPKPLKFDSISLPGFNISIPMSPLVPRDAYMVRAKTILQTYTSLTDRYFDSLSYYDIFYKMFNEGYNWIAQPLPLLSELKGMWYMDDKLYENYNNILWHTATMFQCGDTVIVNDRGPGTIDGLDWMIRNFPDPTNIRTNRKSIFESYGHIDHGFILIDDETVIHGGIDWVPHCLRDKNLIDIQQFIIDPKYQEFIEDIVKYDSRYDKQWIDRYLNKWKGYNQKICFDLNVLIVDRHNIIFGRYIPELFKFLKTYNIECHYVDMRHSIFWDGGIHCFSLDIKRKGECRSIL